MHSVKQLWFFTTFRCCRCSVDYGFDGQQQDSRPFCARGRPGGRVAFCVTANGITVTSRLMDFCMTQERRNSLRAFSNYRNSGLILVAVPISGFPTSLE